MQSTFNSVFGIRKLLAVNRAIYLAAVVGLITAPLAFSQSGLKPSFAFKMQEMPLAAILPFSRPNAKAFAKPGYTFLVVALGDVTPQTTIAPTDLDGTVSDGKNTYKPIAFGFTMNKGGKPQFSMIGRLASGDMKITGSQKTFVGAVFVVPESSTSLSFRSVALKLLPKYEPEGSSAIDNLLSRGRVEQDVEGDHWGNK